MRLFKMLVATALLFATVAHSEVIHKTTVLRPVRANCPCKFIGWDESLNFATQSVVTASSGTGNLTFEEIVNDNGTWIWHVQNLDYLGWVTESLADVHEVPTEFKYAWKVEDWGTYVLRTTGGLYAKFAVLSIDNNTFGVTIDYYVQTDGSPNFGPALPTRPSTWGYVKALYR